MQSFWRTAFFAYIGKMWLGAKPIFIKNTTCFDVNNFFQKVLETYLGKGINDFVVTAFYCRTVKLEGLGNMNSQGQRFKGLTAFVLQSRSLKSYFRRVQFLLSLKFRMKTLCVITATLCVAIRAIQGQQSPIEIPAPDTLVTSNGVAEPTPYQVVNRGANFNIWQRTEYEKTRDGSIVPHVHSYTELASGLNYLQNGQWTDSKEEIDIQPDGSAAAVFGAHQSYFPSDIYQGEIKDIAWDGVVFESQPAALAFDDGSHTVIIAVLTNSVGQIIESNQVIYTNAFVGTASSFSADLLYSYGKGGLEQDVILRSSPPSPESLGLSPDARLQVLTEFFNPPEPTQQPLSGGGDTGLSDVMLKFGGTIMGHGRAFLIGNQPRGSSPDSPSHFRVYKTWLETQGRTLLIESVPLSQIAGQLQSLPASSRNSVNSRTKFALRGATGHYYLPPQRMANAGPPKSHFVKSNPVSHPGFVLDYTTVSSEATNFVFQADTTYLISDRLLLDGTNTFEGGTVLKYDPSGVLDCEGSFLVCDTGPYRPAIFTSSDDDSVGETISWSSGSPSTGVFNPIYFDNNPVMFNYCEFRYAIIALDLNSDDADIWNCQFLDCYNALAQEETGSPNTISLHNILAVNNATDSITVFDSSGTLTVRAENVTSDSAYFVNWGWAVSGTNTMCLTNCIIRGNFDTSGNITTNSTVIDPSITPFQTVGAASYYLNGSTYRGMGTTNISPDLLANLRQKTTYPPVVYSNVTFSVVTNFSPQAPRDTNAMPDIGYHYDPLDYVFGNVSVATNISFAAGTAVGWFDSSGFGLKLSDKITVSFNGTATAPCIFAHFSTVQEQNLPSWTGASWVWFGMSANGSAQDLADAALISPNFTHFYCLAQTHDFFRDYTAQLRFWAQNCELYSCGVGAYSVGICLTNCLLDRMYVGVQGTCCAQLALNNCTMFGGTLLNTGAGSWPTTITNSVFDHVTFSMNSSGLSCDYNAFATNNTRLPVSAPHDIYRTNFNWQSSWFGDFYLPSSSPLSNVGSTNANLLSLYHFTTQTNQVKETNSIVDIGYHYVTTDGNGNPLDTNGDGVPDYLEDTNGNGLVDPGELPWTLGIVRQPQSINVVQGQNATFSVLAGGIGPFTYQWLSNSIALPGANSSTYTKLVALLSDEASYSVVVSNTTASVTSSIAVLQVTVPPVLTNSPVSQTVIQGTNVYFAVGVAGNYLAYQWYAGSTPLNDGSRVSGSRSSTLVISNVIGTDTASYTIVATNLFGSVNATASLTVITNPGIMSSPTNTTAIQSDDVTFSVNASGQDLGYQWSATNGVFTNGIPGANMSTYTKLVVQTNDAGWYSVAVTNVAGATNVTAKLDVIVPPWISQQPASTTAAQGANVTLNVTASGTTNLTYQWFKNGTNAISWATNTSMTLTNVQASDAAGYSVLVTNIAGTNMSAWAWLSVNLTGGTTTNGWGSGGSAPTPLPMISMIGPTNASPANPAVYLWGPPISIRASASSLYSYITNVAFYFTGTNFGTNFMLAGTAVPGANGKFALAWTNSLKGTNILKARAWDNNGNTNDSQLVYVIMAVPPGISAGPNQTVVWTEGSSGTNLLMSGSISDDGYPFSLVTNVQWSVLSGNGAYVTFSNSNSLTTPVTFTTNGTFQLRLRVDNNFATNYDDCTIYINRHPLLHFNFPTNGETFLTGTPVVLDATALPWDGTITNVTFYSGTNFTTIGTGIQSVNNTYTYAWYDAPLWTNVVSVIAKDTNGLMSTSTISMTVFPPLAVQFVAPTNGQLFVLSPTNVVLSAQAVSYVGANVTNVVFSNQFGLVGGGTLATNSVYQFLWQDVTNGSYTLDVLATDDAGHMATNQVTITVNAMPTVSIITPTNVQSYLEVTNVTLTARAFDAEDGTNVAVGFYFTNSLIGWATNIPGTNLFRVTWANRSAGNYPIVAVATDTRGASTASAIGMFKVTSTNTLPSIAITYPTNGEVTIPCGSITILATAANGSGSVTNVQFFLNGISVGASSESPYTCTLSDCLPGTNILVAVAYDTLGASAASASITNIVKSEIPTAGSGFWDPTFANPGSPLTDDPFGVGGFFGYSEWFGQALITCENDLYLQGNIYSFNNTNLEDSYGLLKWDGTNWTSIIPDDFEWWNHPVGSVVSDAGGYAMAVQGTNVFVVDAWGRLWMWNGSLWTDMDIALKGGFGETAQFGAAYCMAFSGSDLYIGGDFNSVDSTADPKGPGSLGYLIRVTLTNSVPTISAVPTIGEGATNYLTQPVYAMAIWNNSLYIGGDFTGIGSHTNVNFIAKRQNDDWVGLDAGVKRNDGTYDDMVRAITPADNQLFIGGYFDVAGNITNANGIASWNGTNWFAVGGGVSGGHTNIFQDDAPGDLPSVMMGITGQSTNDYDTYDYASPTYKMHPGINSIAVHCHKLFVTGNFTNVLNGTNAVPANYVAEATWDENSQTWTWSDLDGGVSTAEPDALDKICVPTLAIMDNPDGSYDVFVAGSFDTVGSYSAISGCVARWNVGGTPPDEVPVVAVTNPPSGTSFTNDPAHPTTIYLAAKASSIYTNIDHVDFYVDGIDVGYTTNSGSLHEYNWYNPAKGAHLIKAVAIDDASMPGESQSIIVIIKSTNNPVDAVNDQYNVAANGPAVTLNVLTNDSPANDLKISSVYQYSKSYGIVTVGFSGQYLAYAPFKNTYGTDIFYYTVTNGSGAVDSASVTVNILAAPQVTINMPADQQRIPVPASPLIVTGTSFAWNGGGSVTNIDLLTISSDGLTSTNQVPANGIFSFNWTNSTTGWYTFVAVATDANGITNASESVTVALYDSNAAPHNLTAVFSNLVPATNSEGEFTVDVDPVITQGIFDLQGHAADSIITNPVSYKLMLYQPNQGVAGATDDPHQQAALYASTPPFADVTPGLLNAQGFHIGGDNNGDLGQLNLSGVPNGVYELVLQVRGGSDVTNSMVEIQLESQLKIGQFSFSQQDMVLPVNGIPITVTRTYNSLNPNSGDFGYSWTFALNSMNVQLDESRENMTIGGADAPFSSGENSPDGRPQTVSIRNGGGWDVTLTLPDGRQATFAFSMTSDLYLGTAQWTGPAWAHADLTPIDPASATINFVNSPPSWGDMQNLSGMSAPFQYQDFPGWILTTQPDGTQYYLTRGAPKNVVFEDPDNAGNYISARVYGPPTLSKIVERSGDTIVINTNSIYHQDSHGINRTVNFERDSQGRIIAVFDPNTGTNGLPTVQYVYNQNTGNLIWVEHLVNATTGTYTTNKYHYDNPNFPHYITSIENADGVPVARNFYDDSGRLIAVQDANGNTTQFIHNLTNNMDVIIDRLGHTNTYVYDLQGNVIAQTNQLGQITEMAYDENNNKTNEITFLGNQPYATNSSVYDPNLNVVLLSTDPLGHTNSFTYDDFGNVLTSTDARGNTTTNAYDPGTGELVSTSDALGDTTTNTYSGGLLVSSTDAIGTTTVNSYDSSENLTGTATFDAANIVLSTNSFTYDDNGNRLTSTVWRHVNGTWVGATTTNIYDAMNRVVQTINPDGGTNTVIYDPTGKQQATIDPLGHTTSYTYDSQGRLILTTYPDNTTESSAYDPNGNRTNSIDRNGHATTYVYDALNRLAETIYADGSTNATVYDGVGRVAQNIDALGNITGYGYDAAGRRLVMTNAVGTSVQMISSYAYDANGNQTAFTDANNHTTTSVYDALNCQVQTIYADGTTEETVCDAGGRKVASTNQDGIVTLFGYDGAGRLTSVTNALLAVTHYQFDEAGNEIAQIDALNRTNTYSFDGLNRRIAHSMPGGQAEGFAYDLVGNLHYSTNFNGAVITNQYDANNHLTNVTAAGYHVIYTYTATGQRQTMNDPSGNTTYTYDNRDRLLTKTEQWTNGPNLNLNYGYNANGEISNIWSSTTGGINLKYTYDSLNRLTNVLANGNQAAGYAFDLVGNLQKLRQGNGVTNFYQYDALNRLTNLVWKTNGTVLASFGYQLGLSGTRTAMMETNNGTAHTYTWNYDKLYRLTNETISILGTVGYDYDTVGNRLGRASTVTIINPASYAYNTNDWLTSDAFDANGNTITNGGTNYQYDVMNRLVNMNSGHVVLAYDGDGNRVSKIVDGMTNYYLVDEENPSEYAQVMEEHQGTSLINFYNYGISLISQVQPALATNYYGCDGHGSVRFLTREIGSVTDTYTYDAYGQIIGGAASTPNNYLYGGQQFDSDLELYYIRARYLDTDLGRFWSRDSYEGNSEDPLSLHKYLYCEGNPISRIDLDGHDDAAEELEAAGLEAEGIVFEATVERSIIMEERAILEKVESLTYNQVRQSLRFTDRMTKREFSKLIENVKKDGFNNKTIKFVKDGEDRYIVDGNNRIRVAQKLGRTDELNFEETELPFNQNFQTIDQVIAAWAENASGF